MSRKMDESMRSMKDGHSYWGFANFPNQVFRRAIKNGFDFTLMVVGRGGLGKSTFINTLFLAEINDLKQALPVATGSTVRIEEKHVRLVENGVTLNLNLVDTPGYGDAVNNSECWEPIASYIDSKYLEYFCEETKIERSETVPDRCVHLCLYFIEPNGHGLKPLDIEFMKKLHSKVNIVPVIAKADCLTKDEMKKFKEQILKDIEVNDIKVYKFPDEEETAEKLKNRIPFAIVGSNHIKDDHGKKTRCREYPWGVVEVENLAHNDFIPLRDMVVRTNLIDMIDVTRSVHYENFRLRQMEKLPKVAGDRDPFTQREEERKMKEKELNEKKEAMEKLFAEKLKERETKINEQASRISRREQELRQEIDQRKSEAERLRTEIEDLRRGNTNGSFSSLHSGVSENTNGKHSPERFKKRGTLGLWNRNN